MGKLRSILSKYKFTAASSEKELQQQVESVLLASGLNYTREARLGPKEVIDFLIGDIGVEIKIRGSAVATYRQLERYAEFDSIKGLILLTWRNQSLPLTINGKPAAVICMAESWL